MSMALNGTSQYAGIAAVPSASAFVMAGWFRRTSDNGAVNVACCVDDGSFFNRSELKINAGDSWVGQHQFTESAQDVAATVNEWRWMTFRYSGNTMVIKSVADGGSAFTTGTSDGSLSNLTPDRFRIGAAGDASAFFLGTVACVKVWSGTLPDDTALLAERLNTDVTATSGLWASYDFLSGELDVDRSGNSRTLTLTATPTYTADKPDDLTIGGGGGGPSAGAVRAYRRNQLLLPE
jgi:hypothetical protein